MLHHGQGNTGTRFTLYIRQTSWLYALVILILTGTQLVELVNSLTCLSFFSGDFIGGTAWPSRLIRRTAIILLVAVFFASSGIVLLQRLFSIIRIVYR